MYKLIGNQDRGDIVVENAGKKMLVSKRLLPNACHQNND